MKIKKTNKKFEAFKIEIEEGDKVAGRAYLYIVKNDLHEPIGGEVNTSSAKLTPRYQRI